jgi:hypothetical protein
VYELARLHGALVIALEHRFYGESHPVANMSTANLGLLSSEQALADVALFRSYIAKACGHTFVLPHLHRLAPPPAQFSTLTLPSRLAPPPARCLTLSPMVLPDADHCQQ